MYHHLHNYQLVVIVPPSSSSLAIPQMFFPHHHSVSVIPLLKLFYNVRFTQVIMIKNQVSKIIGGK